MQLGLKTMSRGQALLASPRMIGKIMSVRNVSNQLPHIHTNNGYQSPPHATRWSRHGCTRGKLIKMAICPSEKLIADRVLHQLLIFNLVSYSCSYRGLSLSTQMYLQIVRQGLAVIYTVVLVDCRLHCLHDGVRSFHFMWHFC